MLLCQLRDRAEEGPHVCSLQRGFVLLQGVPGSFISWSPLEPESQSRSIGHGHRTRLMLMLKSSASLSFIHSR